MTIQLGTMSISIWGITEAIITFHSSVGSRGRGQPLYCPPASSFHPTELLGPNFDPKSCQSGNGGRGDFDLFKSGRGPSGSHRCHRGGARLCHWHRTAENRIQSGQRNYAAHKQAHPAGRCDRFGKKGFLGTSYGWITRIGLIYVQVATRNGTLELVPNEVFVTQKIQNLSFSDNLVRLDIPVGISYGSDLKKAIMLAASAAMSINRVLKIPEPKCLVREFGDSSVNLLLRVWIEDPQNGIGSVKDAVLLAVWDSFHANGIEFPFPQRDVAVSAT